MIMSWKLEYTQKYMYTVDISRHLNDRKRNEIGKNEPKFIACTKRPKKDETTKKSGPPNSMAKK